MDRRTQLGSPSIFGRCWVSDAEFVDAEFVDAESLDSNFIDQKVTKAFAEPFDLGRCPEL